MPAVGALPAAHHRPRPARPGPGHARLAIRFAPSSAARSAVSAWRRRNGRSVRPGGAADSGVRRCCAPWACGRSADDDKAAGGERARPIAGRAPVLRRHRVLPPLLLAIALGDLGFVGPLDLGLTLLATNAAGAPPAWAGLAGFGVGAGAASLLLAVRGRIPRAGRWPARRSWRAPSPSAASPSRPPSSPPSAGPARRAARRARRRGVRGPRCRPRPTRAYLGRVTAVHQSLQRRPRTPQLPGVRRGRRSLGHRTRLRRQRRRLRAGRGRGPERAHPAPRRTAREGPAPGRARSDPELLPPHRSIASLSPSTSTQAALCRPYRQHSSSDWLPRHRHDRRAPVGDRRPAVRTAQDQPAGEPWPISRGPSSRAHRASWEDRVELTRGPVGPRPPDVLRVDVELDGVRRLVELLDLNGEKRGGPVADQLDQLVVRLRGELLHLPGPGATRAA